MRVFNNGLVICLIAGSLATGLYAQQPEPVARSSPPRGLSLRFEQFGVNEGLSQSIVSSIFQDHLGFLWFGTYDGLNRFDGVSFTHFKTIPFDSTSISANAYYQEDPFIPVDDDPSIYSITEDQSGHLWVGTRLGLDRFDRATETFTRFAYDPEDATSLGPGIVTSIAVDRSGTLWVGTWGGGLSRMDPERPGHFTHFRHDPADSTSLDDDVVLDLFEDRAGRLWVGTARGLNRMDPAHPGRFTPYVLGSGDSGWQRMVEDAEEAGVLWIVSTSIPGESSLFRFDTQTEEHQRYDLDAALIVGITTEPATPGVLWISTFGSGLYRFETQTGQVQRFQHGAEDPNSLPTDRLLDIYADRTGSLWVGTLGTGVIRFDPSAGSFVHYSPDETGVIFGLLEDRAGRLWMGSGAQLTRLDRSTGQYERWQPTQGDPFTSAINVISTIYEDRGGVIWMGIWTGDLLRMERATERFTRFRHDPTDSTSLSPGAVYDITEDSDGSLWVGTEGGLSRMDRATGRFTQFLHDPADSTSLGPGTVWSIVEDRGGSLWVATSSGLSRMDRATERFTRFLHDPNDSTSVSPIYSGAVFEDRSGTLWVGTYGGLARMDRATGNFTHFTEQNSEVPANNVMGILEDDAGYLWLSTNSGLSRFDPRAETFRNFDHNDGLQTLQFSSGTSAFKSPRTGELFFGDIEGVTAFYPDHFETNTHPPPVAITDFKLFNKSVAVGEGFPLTKHIAETDSIQLRHDENAVSFDFVALHYKNAGNNQYQYKLKPYETDWVVAGTQRMATYTNLAPGIYVFRVKAANSDGVWNEEGASVTITIHPPWWRTTWAYLLYGVLVLAGVFAVNRVQRKRLIRRERERSHRVLEQAHAELEKTHAHLKATQAQLIQQEKMASLGQLTAGIAHEIKNPLNFVNNFSEMMGEMVEELGEALETHRRELPEDVAHHFKEILADLGLNAERINTHGKRADGIVRAMMEHASGGAGRREPTDVNALLAEYVNLAYRGKQARHTGFTCAINQDLDEHVGAVSLVPQEMGRVFLNLLSNAFDAVHEKADAETGYMPTVTVTTRRNGETVEIRIADNGPGINKNLRQKIFEPFYTTKPTGSGTGLGLSLAYDIVTQGHGGTLTVESTEGEGALFVVTVPVAED